MGYNSKEESGNGLPNISPTEELDKLMQARGEESAFGHFLKINCREYTSDEIEQIKSLAEKFLKLMKYGGIIVARENPWAAGVNNPYVIFPANSPIDKKSLGDRLRYFDSAAATDGQLREAAEKYGIQLEEEEYFAGIAIASGMGDGFRYYPSAKRRTVVEDTPAYTLSREWEAAVGTFLPAVKIHAWQMIRSAFDDEFKRIVPKDKWESKPMSVQDDVALFKLVLINDLVHQQKFLQKLGRVW